MFDNGDVAAGAPPVSVQEPAVRALDAPDVAVHGFDVHALDEAVPGPELAAVLAAIDTRGLNGYGRVVVMRAWERLGSWAAGGMYAAMAHVARSPECMPDSAAELTRHFTASSPPRRWARR
jgi:hypothetical protein